MRASAAVLVCTMGAGCAFQPGGADAESEGGTSAADVTTQTPSTATSAAETATSGSVTASESASGTSTAESTTSSASSSTTRTSTSTSTSTSSTVGSSDGTTSSLETTDIGSTTEDPSTTSGDPPDTIWCVDDCPDECASIGPNLSCAGDFESFADPATQPSCPTSDLVHDNPAGPGEWVIRTAQGVNDQWYGHGIRDHTSDSLEGRVFYGDLIDGTVDLAYYQESITVEPNTAYVLEFYAKDTVTAEANHEPTIISIVINGEVAIADYTLPSLQGDMSSYDRFTVGWFSGKSTEFVLEVRNRQFQGGTGLDIAIDDLRVATCGFGG